MRHSKLDLNVGICADRYLSDRNSIILCWALGPVVSAAVLSSCTRTFIFSYHALARLWYACSALSTGWNWCQELQNTQAVVLTREVTPAPGAASGVLLPKTADVLNPCTDRILTVVNSVERCAAIRLWYFQDIQNTQEEK